jgi:hypothetical protein
MGSREMNQISLVTYEEWLDRRLGWFASYPVHPEHLRLDIELSYPRPHLSEVPVEFNPHSFHSDPRECFYVCDDWTTIFDICMIQSKAFPTVRMLVESSHKEPWGERIRLMSTSCCIVHEWWADRQNWNDFAFWRGNFWRITWNEYFGDWPGGKWFGLPFQDRRHYNDSCEGELRE